MTVCTNYQDVKRNKLSNVSIKKHSWRIGSFTIPNYVSKCTVYYPAWIIPNYVIKCTVYYPAWIIPVQTKGVGG